MIGFALKTMILMAASVTGYTAWAEEGKDLQSQVLPQAKVEQAPDSWGVFYPYFTGMTYGTRDMLAGVADIKPGEEIHPPHRHAEEEFLMVIKGEGLWHLNGKDFPAKTGDMLYAAPWDIHGISNTGSENLEFVVWKWNSKGVPVADDPQAASAK